jgi:hypothetical protein
MASLFALGVMSIGAMAFVAALIAFEKTLPWERAATWTTAAILLALGILLLAAPGADVEWEHPPSHFWLVLGTAAISTALAYATSGIAVRRADARLLLISLSFLAAAGFLGFTRSPRRARCSTARTRASPSPRRSGS